MPPEDGMERGTIPRQIYVYDCFSNVGLFLTATGSGGRGVGTLQTQHTGRLLPVALAVLLFQPLVTMCSLTPHLTVVPTR